MITLDPVRCKKCGVCITRMGGYCISEKDGMPVFDRDICNLCLKCAAICPSQAILVNGKAPMKITGPADVTIGQLEDLFSRRRSTKLFQDKPLPRSVVEKIVSFGKYAPNQNKNIGITVVTDRDLVRAIDAAAIRFVKMLNRVLFTFNPVISFARLFSPALRAIKKKMDRDLKVNKSVVKKNAQAAVVLTGRKSVPVTEASAQHMLSSMIWAAEALGVGSCLMDSLKLALEHGDGIRKRLGIKYNVLGVLLLGYSAENVVNVPLGYEPETAWDRGRPGHEQ